MEKHHDTYKHKGQRRILQETLESKGIRDKDILRAIGSLPRHYFLPPEFESHAYEDKPFPIGESQTISQPYTVAYQTWLLDLQPGSKVLEIGTGSGYQAAVLSLCGADVYSIERFASLSEHAAEVIGEINESTGLKIRVKMFVGDGTKGLPEHAPFDRIIVTAGAKSVPKALVRQLKPGGKLVIPVGKNWEVQKMVRIVKQEDESYSTEFFDDFSFVPLVSDNGQ